MFFDFVPRILSDSLHLFIYSHSSEISHPGASPIFFNFSLDFMRYSVSLFFRRQYLRIFVWKIFARKKKQIKKDESETRDVLHRISFWRNDGKPGCGRNASKQNVSTQCTLHTTLFAGQRAQCCLLLTRIPWHFSGDSQINRHVVQFNLWIAATLTDGVVSTDTINVT